MNYISNAFKNALSQGAVLLSEDEVDAEIGKMEGFNVGYLDPFSNASQGFLNASLIDFNKLVHADGFLLEDTQFPDDEKLLPY